MITFEYTIIKLLNIGKADTNLLCMQNCKSAIIFHFGSFHIKGEYKKVDAYRNTIFWQEIFSPLPILKKMHYLVYTKE